MNFVRQIVDELTSGDALGKLGPLLGVDDEAAEMAVSAGAPSFLAGLANLATQSEGSRKLSGTLGTFGDGSWNNIGESLGGDTSALFQKGESLLNNLFSTGLLNNLSGAIARYAGIDNGTARNLLAYLAPIILGKVAALWRSQGGDAGALTRFFAEQKENIVAEMPAGFSLRDVPGLARFSDTSRAASRRAETVSTSAASWVVPLAILLIGGLLLWNYMRSRDVAEQPVAEPERTEAMKPVVEDAPTMPDATQLTDRLQDIVQSAEETLAKIENAEQAEAAKPELEELSAELDTARETLGKLPQIGQSLVHRFVEEHFGAFQQQIEKVGMIPALKAEIKTLVDEIINKFNELSGESPTTP